MTRPVLVLLLVALAAAGPGYKEKMMKKMTKHMFDQMCWGKENMMMKWKMIKGAMGECMGGEEVAPRALPLARTQALHTYHLPSYPLLPQFQYANYHHLGKRDAAAEQETAEFLINWYDFKDEMTGKVGNLSCVFRKMDILTASGDINLRFFQTTMWDKLDLSSTLAGSDPAWRNMLVTRWTDCYKKAVSIPSETLTRHPLFKDAQMARNMDFWMCAMEAKTDCCAAAGQHQMLEDIYGQDDGTMDWQKYGLPADKYELASVATMVMMESHTPMENFLMSFFKSDGTDM